MTRFGPGPNSFSSFSEKYREALERRLDAAVPADASSLSRAMRAALLSRGKRIRAFVAIAAGKLFRGADPPLVDYGAALEAVHAASLVFDDLPSMDDATLRRGEPALHLQFGEATSVLAAIALMNRAYEIIAASPSLAAPEKARLVAEVSAACGEPGSCRGQEADLESNPASATLDDLERIHALKTGALFVAAARGGAVAARASDDEVETVTRYAKNLGLAFQIVDDLLEEDGQPSETGKRAHGEGHRANFVKILGRETASAIAAELTEAAARSIEPLGPAAAPLSDLAYALRDRRS